MSLAAYRNRVLDAMPVGREVTARDVFNRADLPRGWNMGTVVEALLAFVKSGDVSVDRDAPKWVSPNIYKRLTPRPNSNPQHKT